MQKAKHVTLCFLMLSVLFYVTSVTANTTLPSQTVKLIFIHHSTGGNWHEWFTGTNSGTILSALYAESGQNVGDFGSWSRLSADPEGENNCIFVANDLSLSFCGTYQGKNYSFTLNYSSLPHDPTGLYWKMNLSTFKEMEN